MENKKMLHLVEVVEVLSFSLNMNGIRLVLVQVVVSVEDIF